MPLHHLIYLSTPTRPCTPAYLTALLAECRVSNLRRGLTGVLFAGSAHFLQLIEGEEDAVCALYERLQQDPRHTHLLKVADKSIAERAFPTWTMAFQTLDQQVPAPGFQPLESVLTGPPALAAADQLLLETVRQQLLRM